MATLEVTLKSVLTTGTVSVSATIWPLLKPTTVAPPAVVYRRITSVVHQHHGSTGVAGLPKKERFQITCIEDDYDDLIVLQKLVDVCLVGNVTNFMAVQPIGEAVEDVDDTGKVSVYTCRKDYYIWHKT